jgi:hypothetical protein
VRVTEVDPSNTASPQTWPDTVASQSGNDITLTTGLAGFSSSKTYRVTFDHYSTVTATQQDFTFEADVADEMIEDTEVADHYSLCHDVDAWTPNTGTDKAEFIADQAYGDGKSHDVGYDAALANLANMYIDRKSARNSPLLFTEHNQYTTSAVNTQPTSYNDVAYVGPLFFGTEQLSNDVWRYLTLAPFFKLDNASGATTGWLRVTLSRNPPIPIATDNGLDGSTYSSYSFEQPYAQNTWSTNTTTWATGSDWSIALNYKNTFGLVWIMIEVQNCQVRGLAKVVEGVRSTT